METVKITFVDQKGVATEVEAPIGLSVLEVAHKNDIDLEGACEGSLACSTCHVIVDKNLFQALEPASEEEEDMLDLAFGLTHTSRLGCQLIITPDFEGAVFTLPGATRNMMVDK
jgi:2Fe-2S ferredoxin